MENSIKSFIPLFTPDIIEADIAAVSEVIRSGMLVQGAQVEALEKYTNEYIGCKHTIAVSSGTSTLHLMLHVLGIGPGDEVIVPAFSYIATANVVELVGATPIFVDIDINTFNINADLIEQAITPRTRAIMPVHEFGLPANMDAILDLANKYDLPVLEDAACAIGSEWNGKKTGSNSYLASFSLHPRKAITSGEGGLICTNNDELAHKLRILRNHGMELINSQMDFSAAGFNYRMTDFQAALVLSQFPRLPTQLLTKNQLAQTYSAQLDGQKYTVPIQSEGTAHAWQTYHLLVKGNRNELIQVLKNKGIGTNYGAQCMQAMNFYVNKYKLNSEKLFPAAWASYNQGLALPLFSTLTTEQQQTVIQHLNNEK